MNDKEIMAVAFEEANAAYQRGECPVGAAIVRNGDIIAQAGNREIELKDPTAHAEILVLREAGQFLNQHTFPDCIVYTTLWPCPMCANALLRAKVPKVICGAKSFNYIYEETFSPSRITLEGPIMSEECRGLFIRWVKETGRDFILNDDEPLRTKHSIKEKAGKIHDFISIIEPLKNVTRHSWCSKGRQESVPEHTWRMALMAFLLEDEFPEIDVRKVLEMCLIHDLGEIGGDIPAFRKNQNDDLDEMMKMKKLAEILPEKIKSKLISRQEEFNAGDTREAKLANALDKLEGLIQHNDADISTWEPLEYDFNLTYGKKETNDHPFLKTLRASVEEKTRDKIHSEKEFIQTAHPSGPVELKIIKADRGNISDIIFLNSFVQKIHVEKHPEIFKTPGNDADLTKFFESILSQEAHCILIAYLEGTPVGYLWAAFENKPDTPLTFEKRRVYIHHVIVHEGFRRQHIGNALFEEIKSIAKREGIHNFALDTWAFNRNAQRFFEKRGFETYNIKMWLNNE